MFSEVYKLEVTYEKWRFSIGICSEEFQTQWNILGHFFKARKEISYMCTEVWVPLHPYMWLTHVMTASACTQMHEHFAWVFLNISGSWVFNTFGKSQTVSFKFYLLICSYKIGGKGTWLKTEKKQHADNYCGSWNRNS